MKVAIVGSSVFPFKEAADVLVDFIMAFPADSHILTRGSSKGFDRFVREAATLLEYKVTVYPGHGGASNYERDVQLAKDADLIEAFFDLDNVGTGGTQHIVEKALSFEKPVHVWSYEHGELIPIASQP